jgi:hypothetical protein
MQVSWSPMRTLRVPASTRDAFRCHPGEPLQCAHTTRPLVGRVSFCTRERLHRAAVQARRCRVIPNDPIRQAGAVRLQVCVAGIPSLTATSVAASVELTSPGTITRSGCSSSSTGSMRSITRAGLCTARALKKQARVRHRRGRPRLVLCTRDASNVQGTRNAVGAVAVGHQLTVSVEAGPAHTDPTSVDEVASSDDSGVKTAENRPEQEHA